MSFSIVFYANKNSSQYIILQWRRCVCSRYKLVRKYVGWYVSAYVCIQLNKQTPLPIRPCSRWFQLIVCPHNFYLKEHFHQALGVCLNACGIEKRRTCALINTDICTYFRRMHWRLYNVFKLEILVYHLSTTPQSAVRLPHDSDFQAWLQKSSATVSECNYLLPWK